MLPEPIMLIVLMCSLLVTRVMLALSGAAKLYNMNH
jgi:hypothetical protein